MGQVMTDYSLIRTWRGVRRTEILEGALSGGAIIEGNYVRHWRIRWVIVAQLGDR